MKLIVFSKKPLFCNSHFFSKNTFNINKFLVNKINKNLKLFYTFIFFFNPIKTEFNLNSFKTINYTLVKTKKAFLFIFVLKQMLNFFLFKKKYLKISSFTDLCFFRSNLNKFSKVDLVFILNYTFNTNFEFLTKNFIHFFKFLRFFSYNRTPGRRTYKKTSRWVSHIFFKKMSNTINKLKNRINKTTFSLVYWAFIARSALGKTNIKNKNQEFSCFNGSFFNFFNFNAFEITLQKLNNTIASANTNSLVLWQNLFFTNYVNLNTNMIVWFSETSYYNIVFEKILKHVDNLFSTLAKKIFFFVEYVNFYFNLFFIFNYICDGIFDVEESIETYKVLDSIGLDVLDEEQQEELTVSILNGFEAKLVSNSDSDDEFLGDFSEEMGIDTVLESFLIEDEEDLDVDDADTHRFYIDYNKSIARSKSKRHFFHSRLVNCKINNNFDFINSFLKSAFTGATSLNLFLIFYLISYPSLISQVFSNYFNYFTNFTTCFNKATYLNFYLYYNNVYPLFLLPSAVGKFLKKKKETILDEELSLFFRHHLGGFLESFTHKKIFIKIITRLKINNEVLSIIKQITQTHTAFQKSVGRGFFLEEMIFIMWQAFFQKDIDFLIVWFQRTMKKIEFNKHKNFLKVFKFILLKYSFFFCSTTHILGFRFDIRGKIGVTGNAKKRNLAFRFGSNGFSKKQHRLELKQGLVSTETGVLGLTFILAF